MISLQYSYDILCTYQAIHAKIEVKIIQPIRRLFCDPHSWGIDTAFFVTLLINSFHVKTNRDGPEYLRRCSTIGMRNSEWTEW